MCLCVFVFFFFKQKTAYEMRISDWSSDVCSSDLVRLDAAEVAGGHLGGQQLAPGRVDALADDAEGLVEADDQFLRMRADDGACHDPVTPLRPSEARLAARPRRPSRWADRKSTRLNSSQ